MRADKWPSMAFRAFGIANLIFAAIGLWAMSYTAAVVAAGWMRNSPDQPYFLRAFWTMTAMNLIFLAVLGFTGVRLLQLRRSAVKVCNILFVAEIVYFVCISLWSNSSIAAATGVGNLGITVNLLTGYPIVALIGLNLENRRLRQFAPTETVAI
jgi:hypothetical protein